MGLTQQRGDADAPDAKAAGPGGARAAQAQPQEKLRSGTRPRRPDRAVYVPRALRPDADDARPPAAPAAPAAPRRAPRNVYTPPPLRPAPALGAAPDDGGCTEAAAPDNFYIGDYFANGQLGLYRPGFYECGPDCDSGWGHDADELTMGDAVERARGGAVIDAAYAYGKGEDGDADELKRASREINRSSKRIIKQSFDSDVLVISDPTETPPRAAPPGPPRAERPGGKAARAAPKREESDWEAVFDDSGECLDPSLLEELSATVGRVRIRSARAAPPDAERRAPDEFAHVVEVYDFPSEFRTNDLLALFSEYKDTGFEIKWVDDTHALLVFSSASVAAEALAAPRALARCRPLHAAAPESRSKAKKCAEFLQPYRQRPETCTALARRLVSGALGVRLSTASQERAEERRLISRAREKKRQAALHREAAWDGSLANAALDA